MPLVMFVQFIYKTEGLIKLELTVHVYILYILCVIIWRHGGPSGTTDSIFYVLLEI
ncbi:hypothetical protein HanIR_Chr04g0202951 [Helianthus annuus]|nr:hypothetical protein HanIR_Chr04g0202951 [Helianthus annuus]